MSQFSLFKSIAILIALLITGKQAAGQSEKRLFFFIKAGGGYSINLSPPQHLQIEFKTISPAWFGRAWQADGQLGFDLNHRWRIFAGYRHFTCFPARETIRQDFQNYYSGLFLSYYLPPHTINSKYAGISYSYPLKKHFAIEMKLALSRNSVNIRPMYVKGSRVESNSFVQYFSSYGDYNEIGTSLIPGAGLSFTHKHLFIEATIEFYHITLKNPVEYYNYPGKDITVKAPSISMLPIQLDIGWNIFSLKL
jgi:hypothetical protein